MAAWRRGAAVHRPWKAMVKPAEERMRSTVTTRIYYCNLGDMRYFDVLRPRAQWRGGERAVARVAVFHIGETTNGGNIITQANTYPNQALTQTTKSNTRVSQAVASSPWRRPWRPRSPARKKMANTPSPKLISCCNQVEEIEGDVAQLWARWRR